MTKLMPLCCRLGRHRWRNRGMTEGGCFRLQCRCGAVALRMRMSTETT